MIGKNRIARLALAAMTGFLPGPRAVAQTAHDALRVVLIRHGEKPKKGDNLDCQGLNRSLALPPLLHGRFGIPAFTYIPSIGLGDSTKHSRMFQTIVPFAVQYNLALNSKWAEADSAGIAGDIMQKTGTLLVVWEHKRIPSIVRALGLRDDSLKWADDDYDSIWVLEFRNGKPLLTRSAEGLKPSEACVF